MKSASESEFKATGADFMGVSGSNYWVLFIYNHKQSEALLHPGAQAQTVSPSTGSQTEDEGVVINGVRWASRNVDAPGKFAASPEDGGMFYQWNKKLGWDNKVVNSDGGDVWDKSDTGAKKWAKANDPSPAGWRVPTEKELEKLLDANKVTEEWTSLNLLRGRKFTDKTTGNSIFLPAAGEIYNTGNGCYYHQFGNVGDYWSNERYPHTNFDAIHLCIHIVDTRSTSRDNMNHGYSIRPVAE